MRNKDKRKQKNIRRVQERANISAKIDKVMGDVNMGTFWNGLPTFACRGTAIVAPAPEFPLYWAKDIIGERIPVVMVDLNGVNSGGGIHFLDNRDGSGWRKVTEGHGSPRYPHRGVNIEEDSFQL